MAEAKTPEEIAQEEQQRKQQEEQEAQRRKEELSKKSSEELVKELLETKAEARDRRLKEKTNQQEIENLKAELKKNQDAELIKSGDIQKLADQRLADLTEAQKKIEENEDWKTKYDTLESQRRKELLEGLTKEQKDFLKDLPIEKLIEGRKQFGIKSPVDTDLGTGIGSNGHVSDQDHVEALKMNMSDDEYMKYKKKINNFLKDKNKQTA